MLKLNITSLLSSHAKNGNNSSQLLSTQNSSRGGQVHLSTFLDKQQQEAQQDERKPSSCPSTKCSNCNKTRKSQTNRELSLTDRHIQNLNQPRLLSTSSNSWHNMSRAIWQLKATFATSQSCWKRAIVSPDPCNPMTNNVSLPTLFSSELLEETEEPFSDRPDFSSIIICRPINCRCFSFPLRITLGTRQPRRQIHVARWQTTRHYPRCVHSNCLPSRLPKPHTRPSTVALVCLLRCWS